MAHSSVHPIVTVQGGPVATPTLLGQGPARIPTGGKIRAGIKVLTAKAAEHPKAQTLYEQGVAAGQSFEQIERAITDALPQLKTPLVPRNVAWFTVRAQDFPNPEIAQQILDAHGEDRGEGLRLYRFPVVFPSDHWQTVLPHELAAWGTHEKRFWSEYSPDGQVRHCKTHAPVPVDDTGRRVIRLFGGRKTIDREANAGLCDPEACPEYQLRRCNLSGRFVFFMPGIRSISAFELSTNSFYAMNAAIQKFKTVAFLRGGRISGFLDSQRTPFYITKRLMEVSRIDEEGRAIRVSQWIIDLEAPVDVTALLRDQDDADTAIVQAQIANQVLEGGNCPLAETAVVRRDAVSVTERDVSPVRPGEPSLDRLLARVRDLGVEPASYTAYADHRWGSGWKLNPHGRARAWDELDRHANDPQGYLDKIDNALQATAPGSAS